MELRTDMWPRGKISSKNEDRRNSKGMEPLVRLRPADPHQGQVAGMGAGAEAAWGGSGPITSTQEHDS